MVKPRNYQVEYQCRIARGLLKGLSRAQARGHATAGQPSIKPKPPGSDKKLEQALKSFRQTGKQGLAASINKVSAKRFRRFVREQQLAERKGREWHFTDLRQRDVVIITKGHECWIKIAGYDASSLVMKHRAAVERFLETNDISELTPFLDVHVTDISGRSHLLETRPNVLYRLTAGGETFEQVYRLIG